MVEVVLAYLHIRHNYFHCMLMHSHGAWYGGPVMDLSAVTTALAAPIINQGLFVMFIYSCESCVHLVCRTVPALTILPLTLADVLSTCLKVLFAAEPLRKLFGRNLVVELTEEVHGEEDVAKLIDYYSQLGKIRRIGWSKSKRTAGLMMRRGSVRRHDDYSKLDDTVEASNQDPGPMAEDSTSGVSSGDVIKAGIGEQDVRYIEFDNPQGAKNAVDESRKEASPFRLTEKGPQGQVGDVVWYPRDAQAKVYQREYADFIRNLVQQEQKWPIASSHALLAYLGLVVTIIISCPTLGIVAGIFLW